MESKLDLKADNVRLKKQIESLKTKLDEKALQNVNFLTYAKLLNVSGIGVVIHNFNKILYINETVLKKFNLNQKDNVLGVNPMDFIAEELKDVVLKRMEKLKNGEAVEAMKETFVLPTGAKAVVIVGSVPIVYDNQKAALLTITDISKQININSENQLLRDVLEQVPESIIITDKNVEIKYVNTWFTNITGYSKEEVIGKKPSVISSGKYSKKFYEKFYETVNKGKTWRGQMINRKKNGDLYWEEVRTKAMFNAQGDVVNYFSVQTDITEKIKLTENLKMANETLEMRVRQRTKELAEKAESLGRMQKAFSFLLEDLNENQEKLKKTNQQLEVLIQNLESYNYSISHDLKNPVLNIRDLVRFFIRKYGRQLDKKAIDILNDIESISTRMAYLITHLLEFARTGIEPPDIVQIDMKPLMISIFDEMKKELHLEHAKLKIGTLHPFEADYPLIKQVITNILSNALKFSGNKNIPVVEVDSIIDDNFVKYTFSDNGVGFDKTIENKIFDLFYREQPNSEFEGTGIGLAIVKKIINQHGGEVYAKGEKDKGASISFKIPIHRKILKK